MTNYEFETFRTPFLKSKIQRLQKKILYGVRGVGGVSFKILLFVFL
jgi:hypothetical protein